MSNLERRADTVLQDCIERAGHVFENEEKFFEFVKGQCTEDEEYIPEGMLKSQVKDGKYYKLNDKVSAYISKYGDGVRITTGDWDVRGSGMPGVGFSMYYDPYFGVSYSYMDEANVSVFHAYVAPKRQADSKGLKAMTLTSAKGEDFYKDKEKAEYDITALPGDTLGDICTAALEPERFEWEPRYAELIKGDMETILAVCQERQITPETKETIEHRNTLLDLKAKNEKVAKLEDKNSELEEKVAKLEEKIASLQKESAELNDSLTASNEKVGSLLGLFERVKEVVLKYPIIGKSLWNKILGEKDKLMSAGQQERGEAKNLTEELGGDVKEHADPVAERVAADVEKERSVNVPGEN